MKIPLFDDALLSARCVKTLLCLYKSGDITLFNPDIQLALQEVYRFDGGKPGFNLRTVVSTDLQYIALSYGCPELQAVAIEILISRQNHHFAMLMTRAAWLMKDLRP